MDRHEEMVAAAKSYAYGITGAGGLQRMYAFIDGAEWADEHRDGALKGTAQNGKGTAQNGKGTANSEGDGRLEDDGDENTNEAGWQNEN